MDLLVRYDWPGNVRELENVIERAMVLAKPPAIRPDDLPFQLGVNHHVPTDDSIASVEKAHIEAILAKSGWNITRSAEILSIDRVTLYNKNRKVWPYKTVTHVFYPHCSGPCPAMTML